MLHNPKHDLTPETTGFLIAEIVAAAAFIVWASAIILLCVGLSS